MTILISRQKTRKSNRNINKFALCAGHYYYGFISTFRSDAPRTLPGPVS